MGYLYYHVFFSYSFINRYLGWVHILAIVNSAAVSMVRRLCFRVSVFVSFGWIHRSGIAESYYSSIFNFMRNYIIFHSSCNQFTFSAAVYKCYLFFTFFPTICQVLNYFVYSFFLLSYVSSLYILDINALSDVCFVNILFLLLYRDLIWFPEYIFAHVACAFSLMSKKSFPRPLSWSLFIKKCNTDLW